MCSSVRRFDFSDLVNISSSWMANKYPSTIDVLHFHLPGFCLHDFEISNRVVVSLAKFVDGSLSFFV